MRGGLVMRTTSGPDLLLLDTHVWLWLVAGSPDLSTEARDTISGAAASGSLRIAAISLWEIALLASRGRIVLGKSIGFWLAGERGQPRAGAASLTTRDQRILDYAAHGHLTAIAA